MRLFYLALAAYVLQRVIQENTRQDDIGALAHPVAVQAPPAGRRRGKAT